jgi:hypothetical protein
MAAGVAVEEQIVGTGFEYVPGDPVSVLRKVAVS